MDVVAAAPRMESMGLHYVQDVITPVRVAHDLQFGDREAPGVFGHHYDFLGYVFAEGAAYAEAIHYMDEPGRAYLSILRPRDYKADFARRVLIFLSMRYDDIQIPGRDGAYAKLPEPLLGEIAVAREAHMNTFN